MLNIGTLIQPPRWAQYKANSVPLPPKLVFAQRPAIFLHRPVEGAPSGCGEGVSGFVSCSGPLYLHQRQRQRGVHDWPERGAHTRVGGRWRRGATSLYGRQALRQALNSLIRTGGASRPLKTNTARGTPRAGCQRPAHRRTWAGLPALPPFDSASPLANCRWWYASSPRSQLGASRCFLAALICTIICSINNPPAQQHRQRAQQLYAATVRLGIATSVTSFTASDFGRTLTSNGDGSDHGWGSHHFVLGGAVNGFVLATCPRSASMAPMMWARAGCPPPVSTSWRRHWQAGWASATQTYCWWCRISATIRHAIWVCSLRFKSAGKASMARLRRPACNVLQTGSAGPISGRYTAGSRWLNCDTLVSSSIAGKVKRSAGDQVMAALMGDAAQRGGYRRRRGNSWVMRQTSSITGAPAAELVQNRGSCRRGFPLPQPAGKPARVSLNGCPSVETS